VGMNIEQKVTQKIPRQLVRGGGVPIKTPLTMVL
jgi:hypothetical protein